MICLHLRYLPEGKTTTPCTSWITSTHSNTISTVQSSFNGFYSQITSLRWRREFWKEICNKMGMTRSLTTAYHPQADGQTEVLNQSLEISLQSYIGPSRDDWEKYPDALALSYNSTPHTTTGFAPAYLLQGFTSITGSTLMHNSKGIPRPATDISLETSSNNYNEGILHPATLE